MIKLKAEVSDFYLMKEGDNLKSVARAANVSERALAQKNGLAEGEEPAAGSVLFLPPSGNLYTVRTGDDPVTLCGSLERFESLNGTGEFFPGMKVRI